MAKYTWKIAILDDVPSNITVLRADLENRHLKVEVLNKPNDFVISCGFLCDCHIALVDLKWENFANTEADPNAAISLLPESRTREETEKFVRDWINALEAWGEEESKKLSGQ